MGKAKAFLDTKEHDLFISYLHSILQTCSG